MELAYVGFTQEADVRRFRFDCMVESRLSFSVPNRTVQFVVSADMSLFLRYRVPIQEGPSISRGIVIEATSRMRESELVSASYSVSEAYMASFVAARTADAQARSARRHKAPTRSRQQ